MRNVSLIHTVLASLLWGGVVFVFTGITFMKYESASHMLRESRIEAALTALHKTIQIEMDKGISLPELKTVERELLRYAQDENDLISASVFDVYTGKTLFSTVSSQKGRNVPELWRKKCVKPEAVFIESEKNKEVAGVLLLNALSENAGCLMAEYSVDIHGSVREKMIKTALRYAFRLTGIGVLICFSVYFFSFLISTTMINKKIQASVFLLLCQSMLLFGLYFNFKMTFKAFEADLGQEIAAKAQLIAGRIGKRLSQTVQSGVPFDSIKGLETYMDQIRFANQEILFVLITDKTGRVLYESGTASKAFQADPHTGKISLKEGYYNAAEPVNGSNAVIGWVQIGINERFVREKNL